MANLADIQKKIKEEQKKIEELQKQEQELISKEKQNVIDIILEKIKEYGITEKDLGFGSVKRKTKVAVKSKKNTTAVKYRNGDLTWTGLGRKPTWVTELILKDGIAALEKYRV